MNLLNVAAIRAWFRTYFRRHAKTTTGPDYAKAVAEKTVAMLYDEVGGEG